MIDIIKHGYNYTSNNDILIGYKITCPHCDCKFTCEKLDINYDQREGDYWIYCPECNTCLDPRKHYSTPLYKEFR